MLVTKPARAPNVNAPDDGADSSWAKAPVIKDETMTKSKLAFISLVMGADRLMLQNYDKLLHLNKNTISHFWGSQDENFLNKIMLPGERCWLYN
ncbi:MAG: hypothetical protein WDN75_09630 [Bacteroidota bacterium]